MKKINKAEELFERLCDIYIVLMLTVFLFYFDSSGYSGITEAKLPVFRAISGGFAVLIIILIPSCRLTGMLKKQELKSILNSTTPFQKLITVFLLFTVISSLLSQYGAETWKGISRYEGTSTILIYGLGCVFLSYFGKPKKWMLWLLGGSTLLFCIVCILQLIGLNPFGLYPGELNFYDAGKEYTGAYIGTIGNTDLAAAFLCLAVSALWVAVLRLKDRKKYLLLLPLAAALFVLAKMSVLAGIVGVTGAIVLSLPLVLPVSEKKAKTLALIILVLIILSFALLYFADINISMLHEAHEILHGRVDESFGSGRIYIWKNVLQRVPDNIFFGAGPDTMIRSGIEGFSRYDAEKGIQIVSEIDTAHNEYLNILYSQGIFALVAYLAALITLAAAWIKEGRDTIATSILATAVLSYCIQAFFGISMFITAPFYWMSLGLLDSSLKRNC